MYGGKVKGSYEHGIEPSDFVTSEENNQPAKRQSSFQECSVA
jgi:hypothetical protein